MLDLRCRQQEVASSLSLVFPVTLFLPASTFCPETLFSDHPVTVTHNAFMSVYQTANPVKALFGLS